MRTVAKAGLGATAAVVLVATGFQVAQAVTEPSVPTYTGCLAISGTHNGKLFAIATGSSPTRGCTSTEKQIRLSSGDITSVAGGNGVRVIGTEFGLPDGNGDVALELDPSYRLPQTCTEGQLLRKGSGSAWACQAKLGRGYFGWTSSTERQVGNDWSVLGDGMNLPAGRFMIEAKAQIKGSYEDDTTYAECRLDMTGYPSVDQAVTFDQDSVQVTPIVLSIAADRTEPFRVSVVCRDKGHDTKWSNLRIIATPVPAFTSVPLPAG